MNRIAVIGAGYWGPNLIRNLNEVRGAEVAYVADLRAEKLASVHARYPAVHVTTDYREVLADSSVDAVVVATPVSTHHSLALAALRAGKHVLVEKPLAASAHEADEMVAVARENGRVLMVGHTFIYNPAVIRTKQLIDEGTIGRIYYIDSYRVNLGLYQNDVNVVWDLGPHDVSIILYWVGLAPRCVSAQAGSYAVEGTEDVAYLTLEFDDKVMAHVHISWLAPAKLRRMTVIGSKKMIVYDDLESTEKVKVYDRGVEIASQNLEARAELQRTYRVGDVVSPHIDVTEPLRMECEHFISCIREGKRPRTDGVSGATVVKVLEAAMLSLRENGRVIPIS